MNFSQHEWGVFPIPKTFVIIKITLKSQKTKIFTKSQTKIERDSQKGGGGGPQFGKKKNNPVIFLFVCTLWSLVCLLPVLLL